MFVARCALIACARFGLSEAELLDLLGKNGGPLPRRFWSPFYLAAENALVFRAGLLDLGHEYLRAAVQKRWLEGTDAGDLFRHQMVDYFGWLADAGPVRMTAMGASGIEVEASRKPQAGRIAYPPHQTRILGTAKRLCF